MRGLRDRLLHLWPFLASLVAILLLVALGSYVRFLVQERQRGERIAAAYEALAADYHEMVERDRQEDAARAGVVAGALRQIDQAITRRLSEHDAGANVDHDAMLRQIEALLRQRRAASISATTTSLRRDPQPSTPAPPPTTTTTTRPPSLIPPLAIPPPRGLRGLVSVEVCVKPKGNCPKPERGRNR